MTHTTEKRELTFRTLDGKKLTGTVKNPDGSLGITAAKAAAKLGVAGTFECLNHNHEPISPETRLADLPNEEITLASELTPAWQSIPARWVGSPAGLLV